jgi:uncharacterized membrane protein HdeD (DUF308 family)
MRIILKNWWILTIKGLLTLTFGLITIATPLGTMAIFMQIFGILLLLSGVLLVVISMKGKRKLNDRSWKLTEGFIDLVIGLIVLSFPQMTASIFISLISIWISFMGILQISNGYRLRGLYNHYWILILNGILAISFATLVFTQPIHGLVTLMVLIGLQTIVFGGFLIISSVYIRKIFKDINSEIPSKVGEEANQELSYY